MRPLFTYTSLLALCLTLCLSCAEEINSDTVSPENVLKKYFAYTTDDGEIVIRCEFYKDGHLTIPPFEEANGLNMTLTPPSSIQFNGQEMKKAQDIVGQVFYVLKIDQWPNNFRWEWTDNNGKKHIDEAQMAPIRVAMNTLRQQGDDFIMQWDGPPIKSGEEVTGILRKEDSDGVFREYSSEVGANSIRIGGGGYSLDRLNLDEIEIQRKLIIRNVHDLPTVGVAGTYIELKYSDIVFD